MQKGGVAIEAGTTKTVVKIREAAKKGKSIKCVEPTRLKPRVQVYDVDTEISEEEFVKCLFRQNLEDNGFTEKEVTEGVRVCFKTGKRDRDVYNVVLECAPKIRNELISKGRIYVEFPSCRVVDFLGVSRCFKCQGYGHVEKYCTNTGPTVCSHCGGEGHSFQGCSKKEEEAVCVVCKAAKKASNDRGGTKSCPIYMNAVERRLSYTHYNGF